MGSEEMGWDGMGWDGMGRNGMVWDGMDHMPHLRLTVKGYFADFVSVSCSRCRPPRLMTLFFLAAYISSFVAVILMQEIWLTSGA